MKRLVQTSRVWFLSALGILLPALVYAAGGKIKNPLAGSAETITDIVMAVIRWLLSIAGLLALLALVVGAVRLIIGLGNEEQVRKAKGIITWAIIGLVVIFLAFLMIRVVGGILGVNLPVVAPRP